MFLIELKMRVWWCLRAVLNWIHSQRSLWPHSDLNQNIIQHTCIIYPAVLMLSSCWNVVFTSTSALLHCLLLVSPNYFKFLKSPFTTWLQTTMLKCQDCSRYADLSLKVNQSTTDLLAGHSTCDYRLNIGPKLNVQQCKVLGCVTMCDRQLCVDCQRFIVEGADC